MAGRSGDTLAARLEALASLLPEFEAGGFACGEWRGGEEQRPGVMTMPWFDLSDPVRRFAGEAAALVRTARTEGRMPSDFAWTSWARTPEAQTLREDRDALAQATPEQLAKLLTVLIRQNKFVEGALAGDCESGLLTAVLRRADRLRRELAAAEA